jgi:prepilin-type N-terminal cleavage/methylation domain-containing protein
MHRLLCHVTGSEQAFTLIEVLLVAVILATGLLTFTALLPYSASVKQEAEGTSKAAMLAQKKLETVRGEGFAHLPLAYPETSPGAGGAAGVFPEEPTITWRLTWENTDIPGLRMVRLLVEDTGQIQGPARLEILTYLAARE